MINLVNFFRIFIFITLQSKSRSPQQSSEDINFTPEVMLFSLVQYLISLSEYRPNAYL